MKAKGEPDLQSGSPLIFVKNLKVSVFKAFQPLMFTFFSFPLLKLSVNPCVLRSIYLHLGVWTISTFHHFFTVHQYNCVKIASACVKICCCKLSGNYTVFLLPEDIFVKFGTELKDIGLLANSAFFLSISAIAISWLKPI